MHSARVKDFGCFSSPKNSAEMKNCSFHGRSISYDLIFLRPLNKWKVRKVESHS